MTEKNLDSGDVHTVVQEMLRRGMSQRVRVHPPGDASLLCPFLESSRNTPLIDSAIAVANENRFRALGLPVEPLFIVLGENKQRV